MVPLIALIRDDLRGYVGRGPTLLFDQLVFLHDLGDPEIDDLGSLMSIEQDVVQLDVSVNHRPAVNVSEAEANLLEQVLSISLNERAFRLDELQ